MTTDTSETDEAQTAPVCEIDGCTNDVVAKDKCWKHYRRQLRRGSQELVRMSNKGKPCGVEGCPNGARSLGLCDMHYNRQFTYGDPGQPEPLRGSPVYERAMRLVNDSGEPGKCHPWTGALNKQLPVISEGTGKDRTIRSVRRVIAEHYGLLDVDDDQALWVRMQDGCDPLCCNIRHMEATNADRRGTRKDR